MDLDEDTYHFLCKLHEDKNVAMKEERFYSLSLACVADGWLGFCDVIELLTPLKPLAKF